jgi:flavin reductase (DIM6/NTAB) family NADH-FMN oxidoreductase RutF
MAMQKQVTYQEAQAARCPREVVIGIARDQAGKYNPITLGMVMYPSLRPPMIAVSIHRNQYSVGAFRGSKEFVVALPAEDQGDEARLYGTRSGRECDKLALAGARTERARVVDGVLLCDAVANFECRLVAEAETGDHIVFVGEVVCAHVNETPKRRLYVVGPGQTMGPLPR